MRSFLVAFFLVLIIGLTAGCPSDQQRLVQEAEHSPLPPRNISTNLLHQNRDGSYRIGFEQQD